MNLLKKIPWEHGGNDYEIRVLYDDRTINVVAFLNSHPANGFRHQVQLPKGCDAKIVLEKHPVPDLVEACKKDIEEKRWEGFERVIGEVKSDR